MSLVLKDRVLETTTTTGTGTLTLAGAVTGYQAFSAVGDGNTCPYTVYACDASGTPTGDWEVGVGTYTLSGTTLARTTVLASSNSGSAVNFAAGTKRVFSGLSAERAVQTDLANAFSVNQSLGGNRVTTTSGSFGEDSDGGGCLSLVGSFANIELYNDTIEVNLRRTFGLLLNSGYIFGWTSGTARENVAGDAGLGRAAAGVVKVTDGSANGAGTGWLQNSAARARLTADVTENAASLTSLADLSLTLKAGRKYTGRMVLKCVDSTAVDGIQLDFNGGSATMTAFWAGAGVLASGGTDVLGANISTSLAGVINFTTFTGESVVVVEISLVCNGAGTFIPRFAQNSHSAGTATARLGSYLWLEDSPN